MNKEVLSQYAGDHTLNRLPSLSNDVYLVEGDRKYIYRDYTDYFAIFLDRSREVALMKQLSQQSIGPQIIYADEHCRIEEYLPYKSVTLGQLKTDYLQVAELIASLHKMNGSIYEPEASIKRHLLNPLLKETVMSVLVNQTQTNQESKHRIIKIFEQVFSEANQQRMANLLNDPCLSNLDLVLAHNDLNATNFLVNEGRISLIDYEYAGLNYPGYEIANFFGEMQWDYRYENPPYFKLVPGLTELEKKTFVERYWKAYSGSDDVPDSLYAQIQICYTLQNYFWLLIGALSLVTPKSIDLEAYIETRFALL